MRDLLLALKDAGSHAVGCAVEIIVVDNDAEMTARAVVEKSETAYDQTLRYVHEPVANISRARNRALNEASHPLCLFLDDDQLIAPEFFTTLKQTVASAPNNFGALRLAIKWRFETPVPRWKTQAITGNDSSDTKRHLRPLLRTEMGTGGLLVNKKHLPASDVPYFDTDLGRSGGEDVDFFLRASSSGCFFYFASTPPVIERVPEQRSTCRYAFQSAHRKGFVDAKLALRNAHSRSPILYICKTALLVATAALLVPLSAIRGRKGLLSAALLLSRQIGKLVACRRSDLQHYAQGKKQVVLHLTGGGQDGGAEKIIEQISLHTEPDTTDLCFFFYDSGGARNFSEIVNRRWPHVFHHKKSAGIDLLLWLRLIKFTKQHCVNVVHTHDIGAMLHASVAKIANPRLRLIHTEHTLHYWISRKKYRLLYRTLAGAFARIACVSGFVQQELLQKVSIPKKKLQIVPNGVDTQAFSAFASADEHRKNVAEQSLRLVSVSRIDRLKNIGQILRAIALARRQGLNVTLTHVGSGKEEDVAKLRYEINQLGLDEVITLAGYQTDVAQFLAAADCFISASQVECHPVSVLEAMASGKPCVLSGIEPHKELLQDGIILFGDDDESAAEALIKINGLINSYPHFAYNLIKTAQKSYSIPAMLTRYSALYAGF